MKKFSKSYHDCYIIGVLTDPDEDVLELMIGCESRRSLIRFNGVKRCRIDNFTIGNILLDMEIFTGEDFSSSIIDKTAFQKLFYFPNELQFYKNIVDEIHTETLSYVEISPSYGCNAMILFSDFEEVQLE